MLKRDITYENLDGETITETFNFNLTRTELLTLQIGYEGGLEEFITKIVAAEDIKTLFEEFKKIILLSYGVRDGNRFIKSDALREEFSQTLAYDQLIVELATNDTAAATFIKGIIPRDWAAQVDSDKPAGPIGGKIVDVPLPPPPPQAS